MFFAENLDIFYKTGSKAGLFNESDLEPLMGKKIHKITLFFHDTKRNL